MTSQEKTNTFIAVIGIAVLVGVMFGLASKPRCPEAPVLDAVAWQEAQRLAAVAPEEGIEQPTTVHFSKVRLMETDGCLGIQAPGFKCVQRICGETGGFTTPRADESGLDFITITTTFMRPEEEGLLAPILVHEYLHAIWIQRLTLDPGFIERNPDSEEWVRSLVASTCPNR